jgi:hypothetical protein
VQFPPEQRYALQKSGPSQTPPSTDVGTHAPVKGSQASAVHGLPSLHTTGAWTQAPVTGLQESVVHGSWSSQLLLVPRQIGLPAASTEHVSLAVQML